MGSEQLDWCMLGIYPMGVTLKWIQFSTRLDIIPSPLLNARMMKRTQVPTYKQTNK